MVERTAEIDNLNEIYNRSGNQLVIMYGRKCIGKTSILNTFIEEKTALYYMSTECSDIEQFNLLRNAVGFNQNIETYEDIYNEFDKRSNSKKIYIFDEFQNIIKNDEKFMNTIISLVEGKNTTNNCFIILCSSCISWIENDMLKKIGQAAFKITSILKIKELGFVDIVDMYSEYTAEDCVMAYAILGGTPYYLEQFSDKITIAENIKQHILDKNSMLYKEADNILKRDLREISIYNTILYVIAQGNNKLNDIHKRTGYSRAKISVYMKNLSQIDIIERINSIDTDAKENTKKGIYRIKDNFIHFYYRFVFPNLSNLEQGKIEEVYEQNIEPYLAEFIQIYFVKVCREYLALLNEMEELPIKYDEIGEWHGKQDTIDIIALDKKKNNIVAKCYWNKEPMTTEIYENLLVQMEQAKIKSKCIYLFSRCGFDQSLIEGAKKYEWLNLIDIKEF